MPYMTVKNGPPDKPFCVYKHDASGNPTGPTLGCHPTIEKANSQIAAVIINEGIRTAVKRKRGK